MAETDKCYMATDPKCGHVVGATVIRPGRKADANREAAKWMRAGCTVETVDVATVRGATFCTCHASESAEAPDA